MLLIPKFLDWLARRASPLLAAALFVGMVVPPIAHLFRPLLAPSVIILLTATLLRIDWHQAFVHMRRPGRAALVVAWLLIGAPIVMWTAVRLLTPPPTLASALVLMASSPVLISIPTFALMLGLDAPLALVIVITTAVLQPVLQPPLVLALLGIELDIGVGALMARLAIFVGGAFVLAFVIRALAGPERLERAAGPISGVAVLMLIVFGIGVVDGVTETLLERPSHVLMFVAGAFAGNFALQLVGGLVFWGISRSGLVDWRQGLTAALASGNRNLAILVAVLGQTANPDLTLYLAVGQFPMYLIPALLGPIYRRLLARPSLSVP